NTVVLDKTGTLTFGLPEVAKVIPADGVTEAELLAAAASAELRSEHPLGKAILRQAETAGIAAAEPERISYTPGRGIAAIVGGARVLVGNEAFLREHGIEAAAADLGELAASPVLVASGEKFLGTIAVADQVRPEARAAVAALHRRGIRTILLTG